MTRKPAGPHGSTTRSGGRKGTVPAQPTIHQDKVDSEVAPTKGTEHALEKVSERASGKGASVQVPGEKHESPKKGPEQEAEKGHDSETEPSTGKAGDDKVTGKRPAEEAPTTSEQPVGLKRQKMACGRNGVVVGPRIPFQYFVTKGFGDTDEGTGSDPYETGSYDMALETAKIHQFNIIQYTSVLPPEAVEVPLQNAERTFMHGAVLETIMSVMHGTKGDRICAGIGRIHVRRKKDKFVIGGYAAEYKGHACAADATKALQDDLRGIVERRYSNEEYEGFDESYTVQEHEVKKSYGTVLAAICFTSYILPEIASSVI